VNAARCRKTACCPAWAKHCIHRARIVALDVADLLLLPHEAAPPTAVAMSGQSSLELRPRTYGSGTFHAYLVFASRRPCNDSRFPSSFGRPCDPRRWSQSAVLLSPRGRDLPLVGERCHGWFLSRATGSVGEVSRLVLRTAPPDHDPAVGWPLQDLVRLDCPRSMSLPPPLVDHVVQKILIAGRNQALRHSRDRVRQPTGGGELKRGLSGEPRET